MKEFNNFKPSTYKTNDGLEIWFASNFTKSNSDPIIVFNYGLVCTHQHWQYQIDFLNEKGFKILLHDFRGHYTNQKFEVENITIQNMTADLKLLLDQLKIKSTYMFGHSMGVNITLEFARRFPKLVEKMVLITGTVLPVDSVLMKTSLFENISNHFKPLSKKSPSLVKKLWQQGLKNPLVKEIIFKQGFNPKRTSKQFVNEYMENISKLPMELFFQLLHEMSNHHLLPYLDEIEQPTLIIKGGKDNVIPPQVQDLIHQQMPNSELFELLMGSHVPQVDFPQKTNKRVLFFLS